MKLFFKKLLIAPLYIGIGFAAMFVFVMLLQPLNLPYLLKMPEEGLYLLIIALVLLFIAVVETIVRTDQCRRKFSVEPDGKPLLVRVLTFREYHMEIAVVAALSAVWIFFVGSGNENLPFWALLLGTIALSTVATTAYAVADAVIWLIAAKRAHGR